MAVAVPGVRASAVEPFRADGAVEAARDLYERHGRAIFRFCRSRLRTHEEAEDAGQTTFLYAFRALSKGVVPVSELSWLLKIAENVCKTRRHDARRRFALEVSEDPEQLGRIAAPVRTEPDLLIPLEDALGRLTDAQRQALLLREWQGLSYREIAESLGIGQGAVEVLLFRARRALAEELETPGKRRRARALDLAWLAGLLKQFVGGGIAGKAVLAAVAAGVAAAVSTVAVAVGSDSPRPVEPVRGSVAPSAVAPAAGAPRAARQAPAPAQPAQPVQPVQRRKDRTTARPGTERRSEAVVAPAEPRAAVEPAQETPAAAPAAETPRATTVDEATKTVDEATKTVAPVVGTVESTVQPVVGAVESVVEDVVETVEPAIPVVPALPEPPQLP